MPSRGCRLSRASGSDCSEYPLPRAQVKQQRCDFCGRTLEPITVV